MHSKQNLIFNFFLNSGNCITLRKAYCPVKVDRTVQGEHKYNWTSVENSQNASKLSEKTREIIWVVAPWSARDISAGLVPTMALPLWRYHNTNMFFIGSSILREAGKNVIWPVSWCNLIPITCVVGFNLVFRSINTPYSQCSGPFSVDTLCPKTLFCASNI